MKSNFSFILIVLLSFSINLFGLDGKGSFIEKNFPESDKTDDSIHYYYNLKKKNTLVFHAIDKDESLDYHVFTYFFMTSKLDGELLDVRFYNNNYIFTVYNVSEHNSNNNFYLYFGTTLYYDFDNALNKVIETLKQGNITMQITTTTKTYKYPIDDNTAKIFAELLLYSSQN